MTMAPSFPSRPFCMTSIGVSPIFLIIPVRLCPIEGLLSDSRGNLVDWSRLPVPRSLTGVPCRLRDNPPVALELKYNDRHELVVGQLRLLGRRPYSLEGAPMAGSPRLRDATAVLRI